jgi:hypothetical protein
VHDVITDVQAAAEARLWVLTRLPGSRLLSGMSAQPCHDGVFARPETAGRVAPHKQPVSFSYQNMTRIAAASGNVSGSHPAWDPV